MLRREQQIGYVLCGVAAAGSAAVASSKGHDHTLLGLLGIGATLGLIMAVRHGHRIITALTGFVSGLVLSYFFPLEVAFLIFSGYLMMRTSNGQAKIRRAQAPMSASERRAAAADRAAAKAQARAARRKGPAQNAPAPKTPPANRRYTPPKNKPTRPS
jgi:purine-cytosine permease-like protein